MSKSQDQEKKLLSLQTEDRREVEDPTVQIQVDEENWSDLPALKKTPSIQLISKHQENKIKKKKSSEDSSEEVTLKPKEFGKKEQERIKIDQSESFRIEDQNFRKKGSSKQQNSRTSSNKFQHSSKVLPNELDVSQIQVMDESSGNNPQSERNLLDVNEAINIEDEIKAIIQESKLKEKHTPDIKSVLAGDKGMLEIGKQVKGPYIKKFKEKMYKLLLGVSMERMRVNKTDKASQLKILFSSYNIDQTNAVTDKKELLTLLSHQSSEIQDIFLKQYDSIMDCFKAEDRQNFEDELTSILVQVEIDEPEQIQDCLKLYQENKIEEILDYCAPDNRKKLETLMKECISKGQNNEDNKQFSDPKEVAKNEMVSLLNEVEIDEQEEIKDCLKWFQEQNYSELQSYPCSQYQQYFAEKMKDIIQRQKKSIELQNKSSKKVNQSDDGQLIKQRFKQILYSAQIEDQEDIKTCQLLLHQNNIKDLKEYPASWLQESFSMQIDDLLKLKSKIIEPSNKQQIQKEEEKKQLNAENQLLKICQLVNMTKQTQIEKCLILFRDNNIEKLKGLPKKPQRESFALLIDKLLQKIEVEKNKTGKKKKQDKYKQLENILNQVGIKDQNAIKSSIEMFDKKQYTKLKSFPSRKFRPQFEALIDELLAKIELDQPERTQAQAFDLHSELRSIFAQINITKKQFVEKGIKLFEEHKINQLQAMPAKKYRQVFKDLLAKLNLKIQALRPQQNASQINFEEQLIRILQEVQIDSEEQIEQCLKLFRSGDQKNIQVLKTYPAGHLQERFQKLLDELLQKINNNSSQSLNLNWQVQLRRICEEVSIEQEDEITQCLEYFREQKIEQIVDFCSAFDQEKANSLLRQLLSKIKKTSTVQLREKAPEKQEKSEKILDPQQQLITLLFEAKIGKEGHEQCLKLFRENQISNLKKAPKKQYRESFSSKIDSLLAKTSQMDQVKQQNNIKDELLKLLSGANINTKQEKEFCLKLFDEGKLEDLKKIPKSKYRQKFSEQLQNLIRKAEPQQMNYESLLQQLFSKCQVEPEDHQDCLQFFYDGKLQQIIQLASFTKRDFLWKQMVELQDKINKSKPRAKTLDDIFLECNISPENQQIYRSHLEQGDFSFLMNLPEKERRQILLYSEKEYQIKNASMETMIFVKLTPFLEQNKIKEVINHAKTEVNWLEKMNPELSQILKEIQKNYLVKLIMLFSKNKRRQIDFNELLLKQNQNKLIKESLKISDFTDKHIFIGQEKINIESHQFEGKKEYLLQIFQTKLYKCKFCGRTRKIQLLPDKSINFNKQIIFRALVEKKDFIYNEVQPFQRNKILLKFETPRKTIEKGFEMTLQNIESEIGEILSIEIDITVKVTIFYQDFQQDYNLLASASVFQVRKIIDQNHVPYKSQILYLIENENEKTEIDCSHDSQILGNISPQWNLIFELTNRCSFEFYGFHDNVSLSFQKFSEFFVENEEETLKLVKNCSFSTKKEEQDEFRNHFFSYLYSGMKKRFPIESIIEKFKRYVSQEKYESIWNPSTQNDVIKVNAAFVISYILKNADSRLRIELMNLMKDNMTLPMYFRQYENISKVSETAFQLNKELLWILKQGLTITSIGLHTNNVEVEVGKSSLLNEIFPLEFEETQNKHTIIKGVPFISIRVFYNVFPLHVIDIPHDCPKQISSEIIKNSNIIILHSWRNQAQTEQELKKMKQLYQIPIICLIRDCRDINCLKILKGNYIIEERPQKITNFSKKKAAKQELTILKQQIFKFINTKISNEKKNQNKIFGLYSQNKNYQQFSSLVSVLEKNMFDLAPIGKLMKKIKEQQQKQNSDYKKIQAIKEQIISKIRSQIIDIVQYLTRDEIKQYQSMLLSLLREKLKTYQSELNLKYLRIYQYRDFFEKNIKEVMSAETRKLNIEILNEKLGNLVDLQPKPISDKSDDQIYKIIIKMIDQYENKIKPEIFSVQLFWRELNYLATVDKSYKIGKTTLLDTLTELKELEINSNFPFQIIDGDLLEMPRKLMTNLFETKEDRAIVITILGPQSSGKSTLLNFLFGCDFATSQGRCTRGVYGTYFKFAENRSQFNNLAHCQGVFVIDTEGLFALTNDKDNADRHRKEFDAKLVLFCLAVSDFIVLNVRGNVDKNTEKIFRLCHQRLEQLNIDKDKRPEIVVVLNQSTSVRKEQSQIQFKQIRKTIEFDLSKSLTLAYQLKIYGQEDISLFGKNQSLTKKYPQQSFLKETSTLMSQIFEKITKKKYISPLQETVQKFQRIWSMVITFPDLSKAVTKQFRALENKIKTWMEKFDEDEKNQLSHLIQSFKNGKTTQQMIIDEISNNQQKLELLYDKEFIEKQSDEEDIKFLIRQERNKINSKTLVLLANIKYQLDNIRLKKRITLSKIEGDYNLKEKAKQIVGSQVVLTEEEKKKIFDQYFNQQLEKIEKTTNLGQEIHREYNSIYDNYLFLMVNEQKGSVKGLPKGKGWIGDEKCNVETMNQIIRKELIQPNETKYEDVLVHTNKIHTNTLNGGRTDATLQYFNMNDYFKTEYITQIYCINNQSVQSTLKKDLLRQIYKIKIQEANQKFNLKTELYRIWEEINSSLEVIGLKFTDEDRFLELFQIYEGQFFAKFINFFKNTKQEIPYKFIKKEQKQRVFESSDSQGQQEPNSSDSPHNKSSLYGAYGYSTSYNTSSYSSGFYGSFNNSSNIKKKKANNKFVDHSKHKFSRFLNQYVDQGFNKTCLCSYTTKKPQSFLLPRFYKHINWEQIMNQIKKVSDHKRKIISINENLTQTINEDLKYINLKIVDYVDWKEVLDSNSYSYYKNTLHFSQITVNIVPSYQKICSLIESTQFINPKQFKNHLVRTEGNIQGYLPLFAVKTSRFEPKSNNGYFNSYVKKDTKLTIQQLKKPQFKQFIFNELKYNKRSFEMFFFNIFKIVSQVLKSWQKVGKRTYEEIYNKVNQQISKFNNDLNQVSCNLSDKYIGYIHSATIYMIWKLIIDKKIQEKRQIYFDKKNQYENEWQRFKDRTSLDEKANVDSDVNEFVKQLVTIVKEIIKKTKAHYMENERKQFMKTNSRQTIQGNIDRDVFSKNSTDNQILQYLESPFDVIIKQYLRCYEESWKNLKSNYFTEKITKDIVQQFYQLLTRLQDVFNDNNIDESKRNFSDIFQIIDKDGKLQNHQITQQQYEIEGKRILFEYFIDTLLSQNPLVNRKCSKIDVKPINSINIITKASPTLTGILVDIKVVKYLSLTNMVMFVNKLATKQIRDKLVQQIADHNKLTQDEDKLAYFDMIKVVVCPEKCPCCGRICGLENQHQHHKCVYGHQMRALNGCYYRKDNNVKEASVIRCESMAGNDMFEYNGTQMTWGEFINYWKAKAQGGWLYDDCPLTKQSKKASFQTAWDIAGQIYCKKKGITYVKFNNEAAQRQSAQSVGAIHYIFALDDSGSMSGEPWKNLLKSFKETIEKIKAKDANRNQTKVSLIVFGSTARMIGENQTPSQVNTNPSFTCGGTDFDPPFNMAASTATKYIANSTVVFIFMTDGGASYPATGIKALKDLQARYPNKLKYAGIQFSSSHTVLKTIANELKGVTGVAYNPEELTKLFMKSIEVVTHHEAP